MSENIKKNLSPLRVTDKDGDLGPAGEVYELDFNRESALFATKNGIDVGEKNISERMAKVPDLFFFAFRKGYRKIPREKVDKIREGNDGLPPEAINYLYSLLTQALSANVVNTDDNGDGKNGKKMDFEMDE